MTLNIVTPCSRHANLPALRKSIEPGLATFPDLRWWIVYDAAGVPDGAPQAPWITTLSGFASDSHWGYYQRNLALNRIGGGWVYFLDDDTLLPPEFWSEAARAMDSSAGAIVFPQWLEGRLVRPAGTKVTQVDMGQILVRRDLVGERRFNHLQMADGCMVERLWSERPEAFRLWDAPATLYNRLRWRKVEILVPSRNPALYDLFLMSHALYTPMDECRITRLEGGAGGFYSEWNHAGAMSAVARGADVLVFANDDTVATPDWLGIMLRDFDALRREGAKVGLLGACSNGVGGAQRRVPDGRLLEWGAIITFFAAMESKAYLECGGFDTRLPAHAFSDHALSVRSIRAGQTSIVGSFFIPHFQHRTIGTTPEARRDDHRRGLAYMDATYPGWVRELWPEHEAQARAAMERGAGA